MPLAQVDLFSPRLPRVPLRHRSFRRAEWRRRSEVFSLAAGVFSGSRYLSRSSALPRRRAATATGATARKSTSFRARLTLVEKRGILGVAHSYIGYNLMKRMEAPDGGCSGDDGDDRGRHALQCPAARFIFTPIRLDNHPVTVLELHNY
eukprot:6206017-Pleurochrysis_carterae.AAC.1